MSDPCLLFTTLLTSSPLAIPPDSPTPSLETPTPSLQTAATSLNYLRIETRPTPPETFPSSRCSLTQSQLLSKSAFPLPPFIAKAVPNSNAQLYQQRLAALRSGQLYTRLNPNSFQENWNQATQQPTHQQWQSLLAQEAKALAKGRGQNRLGVLVGDSLSMWFPSFLLPKGQFWLNQGISGENSGQILQRLDTLNQINPNTIYVMAGINDLRQGATDETILNNIRLILRRLKQNHNQADIIIQSILPTQREDLSDSRIQNLNQKIFLIAQQEDVHYLNLYPLFTDIQGQMQINLTTDGLHLNEQGYLVWRDAVKKVETWMMFNRRSF